MERWSCTVENHDRRAARDEGEERAKGWWYLGEWMRGMIEAEGTVVGGTALELEAEITLRCRLEGRGKSETEGDGDGDGDGEGETEGAYAGAVSESDALVEGETSRSLVAALRAAAR